MKNFLVLSALLAGLAITGFSQRSANNSYGGNNGNTTPAPAKQVQLAENQSAAALWDAASRPGGYQLPGGSVVTVTSGSSGPGFNSTISITYDTEISPGVVVPVTVEYEPPPNMARSTAMRLFRLDLQASMNEFPPYVRPAS